MFYNLQFERVTDLATFNILLASIVDPLEFKCKYLEWYDVNLMLYRILSYDFLGIIQLYFVMSFHSYTN